MSTIKEMFQKILARLGNYFAWLDFALLLILTLYILFGIPLAPFHGDETAFILLSEDYDKIVKEHEFERVLFNSDGNSKQYLRLSTGSILTFSIGFARDVTNNDDTITKWFWGSSWDENVVQGNVPVPRLLNLARACSALMGALGIVLFFLAAFQLFSSRLIAWSATLALATQGSVLVNIRRAMQEGPKFLFLILTIYAASYLLKDIQNMKVHKHPYVLLGIASGLTLAAKQDTAPMLVAIYLALALIPVWKKMGTRTIFVNFLFLGTATILAYAFFLAFMPVFWGWWESVFTLIGVAAILFQIPVWKVDRMAKPLALAGFVLIMGMTIMSPELWPKFLTPVGVMIETREVLVGAQLSHYAGEVLSGTSALKGRTSFLLENMFSSKVMYMEVPSFDVPPFHEQIKAYEDSFLSGRVGSPLMDGFIAVLAAIGVLSLIRKFNAESLFACLLMIVPIIVLFVMIPLRWQRYFLILQIPYLLIAGIGVRQLWIWVESLWNSLLTRKTVP